MAFPTGSLTGTINQQSPQGTLDPIANENLLNELDQETTFDLQRNFDLNLNPYDIEPINGHPVASTIEKWSCFRQFLKNNYPTLFDNNSDATLNKSTNNKTDELIKNFNEKWWIPFGDNHPWENHRGRSNKFSKEDITAIQEFTKKASLQNQGIIKVDEADKQWIGTQTLRMRYPQNSILIVKNFIFYERIETGFVNRPYDYRAYSLNKKANGNDLLEENFNPDLNIPVLWGNSAFLIKNIDFLRFLAVVPTYEDGYYWKKGGRNVYTMDLVRKYCSPVANFFDNPPNSYPPHYYFYEKYNPTIHHFPQNLTLPVDINEGRRTSTTSFNSELRDRVAELETKFKNGTITPTELEELNSKAYKGIGRIYYSPSPTHDSLIFDYKGDTEYIPSKLFGGDDITPFYQYNIQPSSNPFIGRIASMPSTDINNNTANYINNSTSGLNYNQALEAQNQSKLYLNSNSSTK